ncbi:histone-fold-containing protein [Favolaschia claudopus]|uniref:Histone-fold-containing protein n=1 Tax=Favolaschia claudopus TaxID=2862362 RepID=A0AAW0A716_9AGAR
MLQGPLPYVFEDRTGAHTSSDFDDIYDRLFFHVATAPQRSGSSAVMIYSMNRRSSRHRDSQPIQHTPSAILEFLPDGTLGNMSFMHAAGTVTIPMVRYLRKTSLFGRSLSRKFLCSDGREYKWVNRSVEGQEWTCTNADNFLVAHYDLKPVDVRAYGVSGNNLTIYEAFAHLTLGLAATALMRAMARQLDTASFTIRILTLRLSPASPLSRAALYTYCIRVFYRKLPSISKYLFDTSLKPLIRRPDCWADSDVPVHLQQDSRASELGSLNLQESSRDPATFSAWRRVTLPEPLLILLSLLPRRTIHHPDHGSKVGGGKLQVKTEQRPDPVSSSGSFSLAPERSMATQPYVQTGEPLNDFLRSFWQRQIDAAEQETPDYRHPPLPLARIKKVMKSDPDVKVRLFSPPILFCKACEIFIAEITARAFIIADSNKRRTLSRADIAKALTKSDQFDFLIDIVPREEPFAGAASAASREAGNGPKRQQVPTAKREPVSLLLVCQFMNTRSIDVVYRPPS